MPETPIRVLLVDDEPAILDMFSNYLKLSGFEVTTGQDGAEALGLVLSLKPDIVVLDIKMPKLDGWEVCQRIKNDPRVCGTPVIFLTAFDQLEDHDRAKKLCVQGYITKPCEPSKLAQIIKQVLQPILPTR